jgi:hypothetical protein
MKLEQFTTKLTQRDAVPAIALQCDDISMLHAFSCGMVWKDTRDTFLSDHLICKIGHASVVVVLMDTVFKGEGIGLSPFGAGSKDSQSFTH